MEQKVLILYYSQAGQTHRAALEFEKGLSAASRNFLAASSHSCTESLSEIGSGGASGQTSERDLGKDRGNVSGAGFGDGSTSPTGLTCDIRSFSVEPEFKFPWSPNGFFAVFPRCHAGPLPRVVMPEIDWAQYDRVVLASQVWFLAPSLPLQAFLASPEAQNLRGKRVLALVTCRNLWQSAHKAVQKRLLSLGAKSQGQITLCEISPLWASFVTTPRWMLTGKKNAFAFFPAAGINDDEFAKVSERATVVGSEWLLNPSGSGSPVFECNLNRVSLMLMDRVGNRFFKIWSQILQRVAPHSGSWQNLWLFAFRLTLICLILIVGPCMKIVELIAGNDPRWFDRFTSQPTPHADTI